MQPTVSPIIIMSFNRNDYLEAVLRSLVAQADADVSQRPVLLFQDGAKNPFSGVQHADPATIARNLELFRDLVPHGKAYPAAENLGIALNFDRAERFAFEELDSPAAIFLEDDLMLGSRYIATLERLIGWALDDAKIGYVTAYGKHTAPAAEQMQRRADTQLMSHNWAFGLTRHQWLRQKPFVDQYLSLVRDCDYTRRNHDKIVDLFHSWGLGAPGTSQDVAKSHAAILTDAAKVNTFACFGRYIGEKGHHFTSDLFQKMGFGNTFVLEDAPFDGVPPTPQALREFVATARRSAMFEAVAKKHPPAVSREAPVSGSIAKSSSELLEEIYLFHSKGSFQKAYDLCVVGYRDFPGQKDRYGHPAFLKEMYRMALALGNEEVAAGFEPTLAAQIRPGDPCVHTLKARHYVRTGDVPGVILAAEAVLKAQPKNQEAAKWLEWVDQKERSYISYMA